VVGYHRETHHFREEKSTKELTVPQHTRFILPPIHPTKSSLRCMGGIFLLWSLVGAEAPPSCWRKTALPLKSPTGAFVAAQPRHFAFRRNKKSEPFSY
jgi:hypothetical protein